MAEQTMTDGLAHLLFAMQNGVPRFAASLKDWPTVSTIGRHQLVANVLRSLRPRWLHLSPPGRPAEPAVALRRRHLDPLEAR